MKIEDVGQLAKNVRGACSDWTTGAASCGERYLPPHRISMGVNCRVEDDEEDFLALLDTGATVSVVGGALAQELLSRHTPVGKTKVHARLFDKLSGPLIRISLTLLADQGCGSDLEVTCTVMACEEWSGPPIVLGCNGFLETVRVGLERIR